MRSETPRVVLAIGLPGSGKSTYLAQLGVNAISSDAVRLQLADDATDQSIHSQVFATMRYLLEQRLKLRRPVTYIDATNLTRRERKPFLQIARQYDSIPEALFFDVPLQTCQLRNAARQRVVPEHALELMAARLIPPSTAEGFSRVEVAGFVSRLRGNQRVQSAD